MRAVGVLFAPDLAVIVSGIVSREPACAASWPLSDVDDFHVDVIAGALGQHWIGAGGDAIAGRDLA